MQANKLASPRRAVKDRQQENDNFHTVDFSIFRRKDSESVMEMPENGIVVQRACGIPAILAAFNLFTIKQQSQEALFKDLQVINIPREYETYLHDKTLAQFLKIFKQKFSSLSTVVDIINHYPIAVFFLQLFARQSALVYLQETSESQNELMMGNEFELLADMKSDLRGNALNILVKSLKLSLTVKYTRIENGKFIRKSNNKEEEEQSQTLGVEDYCASIELRRNGKEIFLSVNDLKANYVSTMRKSKIELLQRKSRIREPETRIGTENRSSHKQKICLECGAMRCGCKDKDLSGLVNTSNFSKSISGGFAQYGCKNEQNTGINSTSKLNQLGIGFINMSKIVSREIVRKG